MPWQDSLETQVCLPISLKYYEPEQICQEDSDSQLHDWYPGQAVHCLPLTGDDPGNILQKLTAMVCLKLKSGT